MKILKLFLFVVAISIVFMIALYLIGEAVFGPGDFLYYYLAGLFICEIIIVFYFLKFLLYNFFQNLSFGFKIMGSSFCIFLSAFFTAYIAIPVTLFLILGLGKNSPVVEWFELLSDFDYFKVSFSVALISFVVCTPLAFSLARRQRSLS